MTQRDLIWISIFLLAAILLIYWEDNRSREFSKGKITEQEMKYRLKEAKGYAVVIETLKYYREHFSDNGYSQDPAHLLRVWNLCEAYAEVVNDGRFLINVDRSAAFKLNALRKIKRTDMPLFMFAVCADETNYDPKAIAWNKNGTYDIGITQINQENHKHIEPQLPKELQGRAWTDLEKNIAGRYLWIIHRIRSGQSWDIMTDKRGWKFYRRLKKATANYLGDEPCS